MLPTSVTRFSLLRRLSGLSHIAHRSLSTLNPDHAWTRRPPIILHHSLTNLHPQSLETLSPIIFNSSPRPDLVHRVVHWQLACRRQGTSKTKSRSEVAGSGRKIRPQKGTGNSRQGAITSPIFRGGGRAHGPKPKDWSYALPVKVRQMALRSVLTDKLRSGRLWLVGGVQVEDGRTRDVVKIMQVNDWKSALVLDFVEDGGVGGVDDSFWRASHNVKGVMGMNINGANVYDILSFEQLVMTKSALDQLTKRFEGYDYLY